MEDSEREDTDRHIMDIIIVMPSICSIAVNRASSPLFLCIFFHKKIMAVIARPC